MSSSLELKNRDGKFYMDLPSWGWATLSADFDELLHQFFPSSQVYTNRLAGRTYPKIDAYEDKRDLVIQAALPFIKKEDISISIELEDIGGDRGKHYILTLSGKCENQLSSRDFSSSFYIRELKRGSFKRQIILSKDVVDKCPTPKATMENGVLTLRFAKVFEPDISKQPKQIPIE